jgi:biopolymer transport protein ExbD
MRLSGPSRFAARPMAAINLTPLIPVLLAVFAVIAVTATRPPAVADLYVEPGSVFFATPGHVPPPVPFVSIQQDGRYLVEGRAVAKAEVPARLRALADSRGYHGVLIRADAEVPYAKVMAMVQGVNASGLKAQFINEDLH